MFEKSLYDLIRGLRNHKGSEKEYIQRCLKECRGEIRSQDMDLKATALLKLIYLEMVGHDMSWASFHVLEVMSSAKYHQKRVGYLGAVQTFRSDTEVLMLATNLLKKDLSSPHSNTISLPTTTLPHVITPSLALSVMPDILPRLGHASPNLRKKTVVTLYRLALVYPETLRAAWPKIKERLMDKKEDSSVTAAIVNVICELGWRRPHDFLPLAPRLFELLVEGGNNWMAIKLIKLFATLTPLEPRLVRKLLPPLTELIRTTPAMSLLYECINGIIQGGILGSADDVSGREEIATLCVNKLRSMIMVDGDPNLKYVALLAFNKIVVTHPFLVSQQEDVILACIDSPDITIRIKALDLVQGMVSSDNLVLVVSKLMKQMKGASEANARMRAEESPEDDLTGVSSGAGDDDTPPLPEDYRIDVIGRILKMCSHDNYGNLTDFHWYIDVLISLVRIAPVPRAAAAAAAAANPEQPPLSRTARNDVSAKIGAELRNVGVKVRAMRGVVVRAAGSIMDQISNETASGHTITATALKSAAWLVGEYCTHLAQPQDTLGTLLSLVPRTGPAEVVATSLQAIAKLFALIAGDESQPWTAERKAHISLLMARILHVIEPCTLNPNLEVQERAVEFNELLRLSAEAVAGQPASSSFPSSSSSYPSSTTDPDRDATARVPPLLLTQALPSLFAGWELNSVAPGAQRNVPVPAGLDLDEPIHPNLGGLLADANLASLEPGETDEFDAYYHHKPAPASLSSLASLSSEPAINRLGDGRREEVVGSSYQQADEDSYLDGDVVARRKMERLERNRDDPFYIQPAGSAPRRTSTPIHNILQSTNGQDLDIDNIPVMKLDLGSLGSSPPPREAAAAAVSRSGPTAAREKVVIAADETLGDSGAATPQLLDAENSHHNNNNNNDPDGFAVRTKKSKKPKQQSLLGVDSSNIRTLSLEGGSNPTAATAGLDSERQRREDAEMAKAMKEVERLRLEMQRAKERIEVAHGVDAEGTVVVKKKKKKRGEGGEDAEKKTKTKTKKEKKKKKEGGEEGGRDTEKENKNTKTKKNNSTDTDDVEAVGEAMRKEAGGEAGREADGSGALADAVVVSDGDGNGDGGDGDGGDGDGDGSAVHVIATKKKKGKKKKAAEMQELI